nr:putative movement protein [Nigrospora aurantiaca tobamo-like virus 1]
MALRFRVQPLSFPLTSELDRTLRSSDSRALSSFYNISGYAVEFSVAKIAEYKKTTTKPVDSAEFLEKFDNWVQSRTSVERLAATNFAATNKCVMTYANMSHNAAKETKRTSHTRTQSDFTGTGTQSSTKSGRAQDGRSNGANDSTNQQAGTSRRAGSDGGNSARFDSGQATETASAATALLDKPPEMGRRFFDLSSSQYTTRRKETHVPVSRGKYKGVLSEIVFGKRGGYLITGPTGCGKSTVALLYMFLARNIKVLVVEPTQANAANIYHEFKHILPTLARRIGAPNVPPVSFIAPSVAKPPFTPLMVTTTEKYLEYFEYFGRVFPVDVVVVDEFHLPIESMVKMVELVRTFELAEKYVLVSATAEGVRVEPALPPAVTSLTGRLEVGVLPKKMEGSDLDPRRWATRGDGTYAVVAPSVAIAKELNATYKKWGLTSYLHTRDTFVSEYVRAVSDYRPNITHVLEPGVEAGVTISMAVLVSMGASTAVRYDGKVVVEDTQPLDKISAIQRGGRAGRVVPTLYIQPPPPDTDPPSSSALYYRAQAMIWLRAFGADLQRNTRDPIFQTFPRLKNVSRELARACISDKADPFVAVYKHNNEGKVYEECGGDGSGFMELAGSELFLYHWPGGYFVAPIANLASTDSEPASFVLRRHQLRAAQAMVDSTDGLADLFTFDRLVDMVIQKLDTYVADLFDVLKQVFSGSAATDFSLGEDPPEIEDFVSESKEVTKLFVYLTTQPNGVTYERKVGKTPKPTARHSFFFQDKTLHFSFPPKYMDGHSLNVKKVSDDVFKLLKRVLAVEVLLNGAPQKCVDLSTYANRVQTDHVWFETVVRRSL